MDEKFAKYYKSIKLKSLMVLGLGFGTVTFGAIALIHTVKAERSAFRFSIADEENQAVADRLVKIEKTMTKLNAYGEAIADINRASLSSGKDANAEKINHIDELVTKQASLSSERQSSRLGNRVQDIADQMNDLESQLDALMVLMQGRTEVLTHLPSITPTIGIVSSHFGTRRSPFTGEKVTHLGLDIGAAPGSRVVATADGKVVAVANSSSYGNVVILDHGYGVKTRYAHNSKILVKKGQLVKRGQAISLVGSTGRSTGPHLHYEVLVDRISKNPETFLVDRALDKIANPADLVFASNIGGAESSKIIAPVKTNNSSFSIVSIKKELTQNKQFWLGAGMISLALALLIFMGMSFILQKRRRSLKVGSMLSDLYDDMEENLKTEGSVAA